MPFLLEHTPCPSPHECRHSIHTNKSLTAHQQQREWLSETLHLARQTLSTELSEHITRSANQSRNVAIMLAETNDESWIITSPIRYQLKQLLSKLLEMAQRLKAMPVGRIRKDICLNAVNEYRRPLVMLRETLRLVLRNLHHPHR